MPHIHDKYDFTVSMFVLHPSEPKIGLHWHDKLGFWNNFGGHIEMDEDPLECLEHEMLEETGLKPYQYEFIKTHDAPEGIGTDEMPNPFGLHKWRYGDLDHWHIDLPYLIQAKSDVLQPAEGESQKIGWFTIEEIIAFHDSGDLDEGTLKICRWIAEKYL